MKFMQYIFLEIEKQGRMSPRKKTITIQDYFVISKHEHYYCLVSCRNVESTTHYITWITLPWSPFKIPDMWSNKSNHQTSAKKFKIWLTLVREERKRKETRIETFEEVLAWIYKQLTFEFFFNSNSCRNVDFSVFSH